MQRTAFFVLLIALSLQGCGYKGPLYLPPAEPAKPTAAGQPAAAQPTATQPEHPQDIKQ